jgi:hypothetical protein
VGGNVGGTWVNTGSSICCTGALQVIPAGTLVQVLGLSFVNNYFMTYIP